MNHLHGNPILSTDVMQYRQGYRQKAFRTGYLEGSAVPMTEAKVFQVVDYLDHLIAGCFNPIQRLTLERDVVMILLMWESYLRGKDCGKITTADFSFLLVSLSNCLFPKRYLKDTAY